MTNSVDSDQTAPLGAVWSGSALFAQACLSENLGLLRYLKWCWNVEQIVKTANFYQIPLNSHAILSDKASPCKLDPAKILGLAACW